MILKSLSDKIGWIVAIIMGIATIVGFIYNKGAEEASLEGKVFDNPEQKVEVVEHVTKSPTPEQLWKKYLYDSLQARQDSIDNELIKKSRRRRDSLWEVEVKSRLYTDSINRLNADQLYQIKEEIKKLKERN